MSQPTTDYKGFIKELFLYLNCWMKPQRSPTKKFVIFGVPRSGTTLVVSLLDALPGVHCEGELWSHPLWRPQRFIACRAALCQTDVFGFKLLVTHLERQKLEHPDETVRLLAAEGYQIISLTRRNIYRAALSNLYADHIGRAYIVSSDHKTRRDRMTVEPQVLLERMQRFEYLIRRHQAALEGTDYIEIIYEDDLLEITAQQRSILRISSYLGISPSRVTSPMRRVTSDNIRDFVVNAEEIDDFVRTTPFAQFVT